jgi:FkbM family methyltransferase
VPATLRRRLLRLLPLFGARVLDAGPGVAVVTRRADVHVEQVGGGASVVLRRGKHGTAKMRHDCRLVGPQALFRQDRAKRDKALSDWLLLQHLRDVVRRYRVDCVLDVGANRGQYVRLLRRAGYRGRVLSFEPVPEIFAELAAAAADDDQWDVHQVALGREDGELEMHVVPGTLSSLLPPSAFGSARYQRFASATSMQVPVRRLDEFLPEALGTDLASARLMLKLDTQGFDLEAFAGADAVLDRVVVLQSEVALLTIYEHMPRMQEALRVYEAAGFEVTGLYPVSREARTGRVLEYDCIMVRADSL